MVVSPRFSPSIGMSGFRREGGNASKLALYYHVVAVDSSPTRASTLELMALYSECSSRFGRAFFSCRLMRFFPEISEEGIISTKY